MSQMMSSSAFGWCRWRIWPGWSPRRTAWIVSGDCLGGAGWQVHLGSLLWRVSFLDVFVVCLGQHDAPHHHLAIGSWSL